MSCSFLFPMTSVQPTEIFHGRIYGWSTGFYSVTIYSVDLYRNASTIARSCRYQFCRQGLGTTRVSFPWALPQSAMTCLPTPAATRFIDSIDIPVHGTARLQLRLIATLELDVPSKPLYVTWLTWTPVVLKNKNKNSSKSKTRMMSFRSIKRNKINEISFLSFLFGLPVPGTRP